MLDDFFIKKEKKMKEKILDILKSIQPANDFEGSKDFIEDGLLDSFDVVQLVSELENTFNITISALDILAENFNSVQAIEKLVNSYL